MLAERRVTAPRGVSSPPFSAQSRVTGLRNWRAMQDTCRYRHHYPVGSCAGTLAPLQPTGDRAFLPPPPRPAGPCVPRRPASLSLSVLAFTGGHSAGARHLPLRAHTPGLQGSPLLCGWPLPSTPMSLRQPWAASGDRWGDVPALAHIGEERIRDQCGPHGRRAQAGPVGSSAAFRMSGGFWPRADAPSPREHSSLRGLEGSLS